MRVGRSYFSNTLYALLTYQRRGLLRSKKKGEKMSKSVSFLYNLARKANDIEKLTSGDPKRIARRMKNKFIGRKLIRKIW